ncbi:hypothetical protein [Epibacterium ulvae]|uniref:PEP-CTERM protein-sorting domain-containing protein n=1 Tax=Epibacterium ulvae TaxID=1156985 RepID=A0A1G5RK21_9RHOB|nr:hypothetical protein [Epibacterium ulvae]SCZ73721.1 hypothetical protein SAMN04488118_11832 [Epibacterium ulvae]
MLVIAGVLIGLCLGPFQAKKRGGNRLDMLQYGVIYAMIFGVFGLIATIITHRLVL